MKTIKRIFLTLIVLILVPYSLGWLRVLPSATARAQTSESLEDSLFFVDPSFVQIDGDNIYVYDEADQTIKVVDKNEKYFKSENDRYYALAEDMLFFENYMLLYNSNSFELYNLETNSLVEDFDATSFFDGVNSIADFEIVSSEESSYILLYPENPIENDFVVAKIEKTDTSVQLSDVSKFKIDNQFNDSIANYSVSHAIMQDEKIYIILATQENKIFTIVFDPSHKETNITQLSSVTIQNGDGFDFEEGEEIQNICEIKYQSQNDYLALITNKKIRFYAKTLAENKMTLTLQSDKIVALSEDLNATDICGKGSVICFVSREKQALTIYCFDEEEFGPHNIKNKEISESLYDSADFVYARVNAATKIYPNPFSRESEMVAEAQEGDEIAIIGEGKYTSTNEKVNGWVYCLLTRNSINYYGFISNINLAPKQETSYDRQYVTVLPRTSIYSMPSNVLDEKNTQVRLIDTSSSARLEVLSSLSDYTTYFETSSGRSESQYLRVKVNGNDIGFVDRARIINSVSIKDRVIPDATVLRNNSEIFVNKSNKSEVIMMLDKGARVKVIGKRDTKTNLTHIVFNDTHGNEVEGYIYTYNLEADSWNLVQMIGILLILINVVLLVIIICVKNKVTR